MNLLFYLNSTNAETKKIDDSAEINEVKRRLKTAKKGHKQRKLQKRLMRLQNKSVVTVVAPSLKLERDASGSTGIKVRRHWVRGHERHYWVGTGEDRKLVLYWIKPFKRGSTVAEAIREHYDVK